MAGVKNVLELIDLVGVVSADIVAARADGSITFFDIPKFADVPMALNAALDGADQVVAELKDLDSSECQVIVLRLMSAANDLSKAIVGVALPEPYGVIVQKLLDLVSVLIAAGKKP